MNVPSNSLRFFVLTVIVGTQGCSTTLDSHYIRPDSKADIPPGAMLYALPKTKLTTAFTVVLTGCKPGTKGSTLPTVNLKVAAATSQSFEADSERMFYVDYQKLSVFLKTTSLKITTGSDLTLQSFNAETNDQTMQVAGSALQAVIQVGGAIALAHVAVPHIPVSGHLGGKLAYIPSPHHKAPVPETINACSEGALTALDDLAEKQKALLAAVKTAKTATDPKLVQATTDKTDAIAKLTAAIPIVPDLKTVYDKATSYGTAQRMSWQVNLAEYLGKKWLSDKIQSNEIQISYNGGSPVNGSVPIEIQADVSFWSRPPKAEDKYADPKAVADHQKIDGVVVRQPAIGSLRVCIAQCNAPDQYGIFPTDSLGVSYDLAPQTRVVLPQFGKELLMPLHNTLGTDGVLGVTLAQDGSINVMSFQSTTTAAAGLNAIGAAGTAYATAVTSRNNAISTANTAAAAAAQYPDVALKAQADCLAQRAAITAAGSTPVTTCP